MMNRKQFLKTTAGAAAGMLAGISVTRTGEKELASPRPLGNTGLHIVPLGYGATRTLEPALAEAALDGGLNFIDTGRNYFNGKNEEMLGNVLKGRRDSVVIQSKISLRIRQTGDDLHSAETAARISRLMEESLAESLKALKTDYIDVMLLHNHENTDLLDHDTVKTFFIRAKQAGKIRTFGFSSHRNFIRLMKWTNENPFYETVMLPYNHRGGYVHSESHYSYDWNQQDLEEQLRIAHSRGMGIVAMKTCSGGPLAEKHGGEPSYTEALRWVMRHEYIHGTAVAMANEQEITQDLAALKE